MGVAAVLPGPADFAAWRQAARGLLGAGVTPEETEWRVAGDTHGPSGAAPRARGSAALPASGGPSFHVPRGFMDLAEVAIRHRDPERFALLYRVLWRLTHGEHELIQAATDPDIVRLTGMAEAVLRDAHRMRALLRFRQVATGAGIRHVAWFEPEHHIEEAEAGFFVRRFAGLRWTIVTPRRTVHWDGQDLAFGPGGRRMDVPPGDLTEPLRLAHPGAPSRVPPGMDDARNGRGSALAALARELAGRNDLPDFARRATRLVFGEGPPGAPLCFVGEQPGDEEDIQGRPFVGPAGRLFDRALGEAGVPRDEAYVTNAVKHFKFEPRGKRRLHQSPDAGDIAYYRPFLLREIGLVGPRLLVALGATALRALAGKAMPVMKTRGTTIAGPEGLPLFVTVHPSYLLRIPDQDGQRREYGRFVEDLRAAHAQVA